MFEVIFDIETKKLFDEVGWDNADQLGVSIVSLYCRTLDDNLEEKSGKMESFWEKDIGKMWPIFQKADRIIGFNTLGFDVPVLQPYANFPLKKLMHLDLMNEMRQVLGHRLSLNALAAQTLGEEKTDVGTNAVKYYRLGDKKSLDKLQKYCEADVDITKRLYDYGLKNNRLMYKDKWNTEREVEVDFSYPESTPATQDSLF